MASRGRGRRGDGRGNNQPPQAFDQQGFIQAIGTATTTIARVSVVATTIAQASAIIGKEGSGNLQSSRHIIIRPSRDKGTLWKLTIGSNKSERFWRLWRLPPMPLG